MNPVRLSTEGSDRATAYNISNKLLRWGQNLIAGWLDGPAESEGPVRIHLGVCDGSSGELHAVVPLGEGIDNHCGPALLQDQNNRVHALIGAHHGDFLHRWSDNPADPSSWSEPDPIGPKHSYPAFIIDAEGTFHLAYRESGDRWQLHYTRKRPGQNWEQPTIVAQSPTPGYNHFMHSLSIGPSGRLHLTFQFHFSETGSSRDCLTKGAAHIFSDDGGDTWDNDGRPCAFPLTIETTNWITECLDDPDASMRIGTHVTDRDDRVWLFASVPHPDRGVMWRQSDSGWEAIDLSVTTPNLELSGGKSTAISYDDQDNVHLLISTDPAGKAKGWYDPSIEVYHLAFTFDGSLTSCDQITTTDSNAAHWLPAIEQWDWVKPDGIGVDGHWYLYTAGINAGLMNQSDYNDILRTEVYLGRLG